MSPPLRARPPALKDQAARDRFLSRSGFADSRLLQDGVPSKSAQHSHWARLSAWADFSPSTFPENLFGVRDDEDTLARQIARIARHEPLPSERKGRGSMRQTITPIPIRPWMLNGISERMLVSHYENDYGTAVRTLNEIREELGELDLSTARGYRVRALKREEHAAMGSVALHEIYFRNLGGDGRMTSPMAAAFTEHFGSVESWRREFMATARSLRG